MLKVSIIYKFLLFRNSSQTFFQIIIKDTINAVYADGLKFSHPLNHLGKSANDLPLLAIDSFRHMYLFPKSFKDIGADQNLLKFVTDLHSGKLHREFHNGPDPTEAPSQPIV